ncbi:hypothetical protein EYF80_012579 [Liparis tanakae]|uniref:Uncharacterized protein n=1 Tax=Liparis tanakae TaxID=230148 RepID=A0A4Z2IJ22_9TELE|nr:hypothetical protein EYF80_012579 [Liparis tanakae]
MRGRREEEEEEKEAAAAAALTVQILGSRQVDDSVDHLPGVLPELPQVLTQRLIVQPLLEEETRDGYVLRNKSIKS